VRKSLAFEDYEGEKTAQRARVFPVVQSNVLSVICLFQYTYLERFILSDFCGKRDARRLDGPLCPLLDCESLLYGMGDSAALGVPAIGHCEARIGMLQSLHALHWLMTVSYTARV